MNHPEKGDTKGTQSVVAVVGSTDGMLGQYAAHISVCEHREEPVQDLVKAFTPILTAFCNRNGGRPPKRILVYRDGVAENQFNDVVENELPALHEALRDLGYDNEYVKVAIVVCQKRHHSRFVYEAGNGKPEGGGGGSRNKEEVEYLNPCVGLCVDARQEISLGGTTSHKTEEEEIGSIISPNCNEFYLSSHAAILGTSKMCKYTLIYDEIGLEV